MFNALNYFRPKWTEKPPEPKKVVVVEVPEPTPGENVDFREDVRLERVDFVLCYKRNLELEGLDMIGKYLGVVTDAGLVVKADIGDCIDDIIFIKIFAPYQVLKIFTKLYSIDLTKNNPNYSWMKSREANTWLMGHENDPTTRFPIPKVLSWFDRRQSSASLFSVHSTISSIIKKTPRDITVAERILVVSLILFRITCSEIGEGSALQHLVRKKIFTDYFVLHEGPSLWQNDEHFSDRQLLRKLWARVRYILQPQPLYLIEKYFGAEMAFYFAFIGYFNRLMIPIALLGIVFFIFGLIENFMIFNEVNEFCKFHRPSCPPMHRINYPIFYVSDFCTLRNTAALFDSFSTMIYSLMFSLWSMYFILKWRQYERMLEMRWNGMHQRVDTQLRKQYKKNATKVRFSEFSMKFFFEIPLRLLIPIRMFAIFGFITFTMVLLAIMIFSMVVVRRLLEIAIFTHPNSQLFINFLSSLVYYLLAFAFTNHHKLGSVIIWITKMEIQRTRRHHERSIIYKMCTFQMAIYSGGLMYLALFRGKLLFQSPETAVQTEYSILNMDFEECGPAGCMLAVTTHLIVMLMMHSVVRLIRAVWLRTYYALKVHYIYGKKCRRGISDRVEKDYIKRQTDKGFLMYEYQFMIVQYGLLTFFVALNPLAPFFALVSSVLLLRFKAVEFTRFTRRPIPGKAHSIGAYKNCLYCLTVIGMLINVFINAFSTSSVLRLVALFNNLNAKQYIKEIFTRFDITSYASEIGNLVDKDYPPKYCYFNGFPYRLHENDTLSWKFIFYRFVYVVVVENFLAIVCVAMFISISRVRQMIKDRSFEHEVERLQNRVNDTNEALAPHCYVNQDMSVASTPLRPTPSSEG